MGGSGIPSLASTEDATLASVSVDELSALFLPALPTLDYRELVFWRHRDKIGVSMPAASRQIGQFMLDRFGFGHPDGSAFSHQWINFKAGQARDKFAAMISRMQRERKQAWDYTPESYPQVLRSPGQSGWSQTEEQSNAQARRVRIGKALKTYLPRHKSGGLVLNQI